MEKEILDNIIEKSQFLVIDFVQFQNEPLRDQFTNHLIAEGYPIFRITLSGSHMSYPLRGDESDRHQLRGRCPGDEKGPFEEAKAGRYNGGLHRRGCLHKDI